LADLKFYKACGLVAPDYYLSQRNYCDSLIIFGIMREDFEIKSKRNQYCLDKRRRAGITTGKILEMIEAEWSGNNKNLKIYFVARSKHNENSVYLLYQYYRSKVILSLGLPPGNNHCNVTVVGKRIRGISSDAIMIFDL